MQVGHIRTAQNDTESLARLLTSLSQIPCHEQQLQVRDRRQASLRLVTWFLGCVTLRLVSQPPRKQSIQCPDAKHRSYQRQHDFGLLSYADSNNSWLPSAYQPAVPAYSLPARTICFIYYAFSFDDPVLCIPLPPRLDRPGPYLTTKRCF